MNKIFDSFERWCKLQKPNTRKTYLNSLQNLKRHFEGRDLDALTIMEYQGPNHDLRVLRRMLNLAAEWELILKVPKIKVRKEKQRNRYLTVDEVNLLIGKCKDPNLGMIIAIAFLTGFRKENILSLTWKQIDFDSGKIKVVAKGEVELENPVPEELLSLLKQFRRSRSVISDRVFPDTTYIDKKFRRLCNRLGWRDVVFHTLRHSYASNLLAQEVDIRIIADLLGHKDLRTTMRYTHVSDELKRDAVKSLGKGVIGS